MKSALWSIAKYILAITLLIFILRYAKSDEILADLRKIPPLTLLLCFALISVAQTTSGMRMRFFFRSAGFRMHSRFAIILFYVGAFYNFLLPGGIGGDAYKIILARKRMNVTAKEGIRIMLADRASGLCVVMMVFYGAVSMLDFSPAIPYARPLIALCAAGTLACYLAFSAWLTKMTASAMLRSLPYSFVIQGLWVTALLFIWSALGNGKYAVEYVVLYCASSITGLLPVTVGGLGIKETTYYVGAKQLQIYAHSGVDGNLGIAISLCIFCLTLATSLPGILWLNTVEKADHS